MYDDTIANNNYFELEEEEEEEVVVRYYQINRALLNVNYISSTHKS